MASTIVASVFMRLATTTIFGFAAVIDLAAQTAPLTQPRQADQTQLTFSPWVKLCNQGSDSNAKRICVTVKDGRAETGPLVVSVAIIEQDGEAQKILRMSLPYGVQLQVGARMIVDQGPRATAPYITCLPPSAPPGGCIADFEATAEVITRLKNGQLLTVQAIHMNNQPMSPQFDLKDFAQVYDGPPTDPKAFKMQQKEEQQKRLPRWKDDTLQPHLRPKN
jgi:invasion protein IalB